MEDKIFSMLINEDELTWQEMIFDLVRTEQMNPWDIDVSLIAAKFLETIKKLQELDFRVSGKVLLAAAILLRLKSNRLVAEDLEEFDRLIASSEQTEQEFYDELMEEYEGQFIPQSSEERPTLVPRTPQPRKRKVSIYDLVEALGKALEVKKRRDLNRIPDAPDINLVDNPMNITSVIRSVYRQIRSYFIQKKGATLTFTQLLPSDSKEDKVYTFVPLLHLDNQRKVDLLQKVSFGEIGISLLTDEENLELDLSQVLPEEQKGQTDLKRLAK
ncbi:segregation/condensation protein A [Candidatus Woesearchaeota archaeon]|nr:segregation/condensation protein A [Candidatus Woesearchaeota archaeon]